MRRIPFLKLLAILIVLTTTSTFAISSAQESETSTTPTAQQPDVITATVEPQFFDLDLGATTCIISTTPGAYTVTDYNGNPTLTINPMTTKTPPCATTLSSS